MDARPSSSIVSFDKRMRVMRSITKTIRSIVYHPIEDADLLALVNQIKQNISERLIECYGDEIQTQPSSTATQPKTPMFACFAFMKPNQNRHANKIRMANLLYSVCQSKFESFLQINCFVRLLTEMKRSDEFIDPNHHRFHGIITSHEINILMRQVRGIVQGLNLSSNQNTKDLYKKVFYLKVLKNEPHFQEKEDPVSQVLKNYSDIRAFFGEKEAHFIPLSYEGEEQAFLLSTDLDAARKKRLTQTLEYTLIAGFKNRDLAHIVKYIAMMEVLHCFIDGLEVELKKCAFSIMVHLQKDNKLDAAVSNVQSKLDFCKEVIQQGGKHHLDLDGLCDALDGFKDAIGIETPENPDTYLDNFIGDIEREIDRYCQMVYRAPTELGEGLDVNAHMDYRSKKEDCNPHLKHHSEQILLHQGWEKRVRELSKHLFAKMRVVGQVVDGFFSSERIMGNNTEVRNLDELLEGIIRVTKHGTAVVDASPSVVRKLRY